MPRLFRRTKYKAVRVHHDGHSFASKLERAVYDLLLLREKAGEIKDIQCQDHVYLTKARICYIPDFKFFHNQINDWAWAEAKGMVTDVFAIKKRLWKYYGTGILEIYKGSYRNPTLSEIVIPHDQETDR